MSAIHMPVFLPDPRILMLLLVNYPAHGYMMLSSERSISNCFFSLVKYNNSISIFPRSPPPPPGNVQALSSPKVQCHKPWSDFPTLHCPTALHHTTLNYTTLTYTAVPYTTLHYTTLHWTTLHCTALHYTTLHYIELHCTALHYTTLSYPTLHYPTQLCPI